jgi:hypothetical protein
MMMALKAATAMLALVGLAVFRFRNLFLLGDIQDSPSSNSARVISENEDTVGHSRHMRSWSHIGKRKAVPRISRQLRDYEPAIEFVQTINRTIELEDLIQIKFSIEYFLNHLANKRIVFIGDSVTRYQYIALVYSLSTGHFLNTSLNPNLVEEKTWTSWTEFYKRSTEMLLPYEYCDCFRDSVHPNRQNENRYYFDNVRNVSVVYLSTMDGEHCFGHWSDWGDQDVWRRPQGGYAKPFFTYDFPRTMQWLKKDVWHRPFNGVFTGVGAGPASYNQVLDDVYSVLVMNFGAHEIHQFNNISFVQTLLKGVAAAKFDKFIWKTTTKKAYFLEVDIYYEDPNREVNYYKHDYLMCSQPNVTCFNTSWTKNVNYHTLMWDSVHFLAPVYNHLNVELMKLLGPN